MRKLREGKAAFSGSLIVFIEKEDLGYFWVLNSTNEI